MSLYTLLIKVFVGYVFISLLSIVIFVYNGNFYFFLLSSTVFLFISLFAWNKLLNSITITQRSAVEFDLFFDHGSTLPLSKKIYYIFTLFLVHSVVFSLSYIYSFFLAVAIPIVVVYFFVTTRERRCLTALNKPIDARERFYLNFVKTAMVTLFFSFSFVNLIGEYRLVTQIESCVSMSKKAVKGYKSFYVRKIAFPFHVIHIGGKSQSQKEGFFLYTIEVKDSDNREQIFSCKIDSNNYKIKSFGK